MSGWIQVGCYCGAQPGEHCKELTGAHPKGCACCDRQRALLESGEMYHAGGMRELAQMAWERNQDPHQLQDEIAKLKEELGLSELASTALEARAELAAGEGGPAGVGQA